jgi:peptidoglycan/xylan/chitin deacetylase (PgdA/CDA1 family)
VHPSLSYASASPTTFERHLNWLGETCDVIPFDRLLKASQDTSSERPAVAITFDDGYADNYEYAFPLLHKYEMPATIFVTAGLSAEDSEVHRRFRQLRDVPDEDIRPLTWTQANEMQSAGITIGAHTYSHPNLIRLSKEDSEDELRRSKQILEDALQCEIDQVAYPFGKPGRHFDETTMAIAEMTGYRYGAAVLFRAVRKTDAALSLPRFFTTRDSTEDLAAKVRGDWDYLGLWQERAPRRLARLTSPQDFRF